MTTIYLIRHCEARGNVDRVCHGITDTDITEKAISQLSCLKKRFKDVQIDAAYSSALKRAQLTAKAVIDDRPIELQIDSRLSEIDYGEWENIPWEILPVIYPAQSHNWSFEPEKFAAPKGETNVEVYNRMSVVLRDIARKNPNSSVIVASHGGAIRCALCWAHNWDVSRLGDVGWCDNTAVAILEIENESVKLLQENDSSHLDDSLSTIANQKWWKDGSYD